MKKLVSILLALILVLGLTVNAYAADTIETNGGTATGDVKIKVNDGVGGTVYHVTVEWKSLEFTYQKAGTGTWDPESHTYSDATTAGWMDTDGESSGDVVSGENNNTITRSNAIVVTNHSNVDVVVSATFGNTTAQQQGATNTGVTASLSVTNPTTLGSATEHMNKPTEADKVSYNLVVSGTPTESEASFGTITVKITAG